MGIFSTVSEVIKNKKNFKLWEEKQKLEQAQRQKLYEQNQYSEEEIEKARALGETIIDAIDVMDNHSESVAENVETATEPLVGVAPVLGTIGASIAAIKFIADPAYKKIDQIYREEMSSDLAENLYERISKSSDAKFITQRYDLLKKNKIKKIQDANLRKEAEAFFKNYTKKIAGSKTKLWTAGGITIGAFFLSFIGSIIAATKIQVNSSKVARYQAREQLQDPMSFVSYTHEQIAQAKAEMESDKLEKASQNKRLFNKKEKDNKPKLRQGVFGSLFSIIKDNRAYREAKKNDKIQSKMIERELTPEELIQAEKDKEVIQRTVRLINNEAEKNSENMETAANVFIVGTPALGAAVGGGTSWIINKTGIVEKAIQKSVDKNASEHTKELLAKYNEFIKKESPKGVVNKMMHWAKKQEHYFSYVSSMIEDLETSQLVENGIKRKPKLSDYVKRGATAIMTATKARNWAVAIAGGFVTGIAGLIIALKLQKSAARAGRYNAKRDLEKDPRNFIGYTQEEYNSVKDATPVKTESKFKETVLFIPRVMKQYVAYNKYKKHEFKEQQELRKYLHKQEVTDKQLKDAKNLQRKVFNTFEKVDDNSQKYSESMEAAIDIAQPFIIYAGYAAMIAPFLLGIRGLAKIKDNPAKIIEKVSGWFGKSSKLMNNKLTKGYLNGVADNTQSVVKNVKVNEKPLAFLLKDVKLQDNSIFKSIGQIFRNLQLSPEELRKLPPEQINWKVNNAIAYLDNLPKKLGMDQLMNEEKLLSETLGLKKYLQSIQSLPAEQKIDALDMLLNLSKVDKIKPENYNKILGELLSFVPNYTKQVGDFLRDLPTKDLRIVLEEASKLDEYKQILNNKTLKEIFEVFDKIEQNPDLAGEEIIKKIVSQENVVTTISTLKNVFTKAKEVPTLIKNSAVFNQLLQKEISMPAELAYTLKTMDKLLDRPDVLSTKIGNTVKNLENSLKNGEEVKINPNELFAEFSDIIEQIRSKNFNGHKVKTNLGKLFENGGKSLDKIKILAKEDWKAMMPEFLQTPSSVIKKLKETAEKATPEDLQKIIDNTPILKKIGGLDQATLVKILDNLEKCINNIPKAELKNIMNKLIQAFNENPDEFVKLLRTGRISSIFMTPALQNTLAAAGISLPVLTIALTYAVEAWLANLELKAGRLGVMKSLEELEDNRYYANVEV